MQTEQSAFSGYAIKNEQCREKTYFGVQSKLNHDQEGSGVLYVYRKLRMLCLTLTVRPDEIMLTTPVRMLT